MKQYDRYRDTRTGDIWTLLFDEFNRPYVFNPKLGLGLWDHGKHLEPLQ
jgi:hypothetical protein